ARATRSMKSNTRARITPRPSTHRVATALFGITRSYTFIVNSGIANAHRLTISAASRTGQNSLRTFHTSDQNQWARVALSHGRSLSRSRVGSVSTITARPA